MFIQGFKVEGSYIHYKAILHVLLKPTYVFCQHDMEVLFMLYLYFLDMLCKLQSTVFTHILK